MAAPLLSSYAHGSQQSLNGGAKSTKTAVDWDEEVVPALKRRLAAEDSRTLEEPLHTDERRMPAGRTRPAPRQNQYDEIIQDGLGNDELIPSEWATGSKARFLTANSRNDRHAYSQQDSSRSLSDTYAQSRSVNHDAYNHGDTTWSAGDRRHRPDYASSPGNLVEDGRGSREAMHNVEGEEIRMAVNKSASAMLRASSNPSLLDSGRVLRQVDPNTLQSKENDQNNQIRAERLRTSSQGSAVLLKNGSPSRIPTLKPGVLLSGQKLESPTSRSRAAGTSATSPQSAARSISQHSPSSQQIRQRTVSTSSAKRTPSKRTEHMYNDVPISQEVLDEFGPLGGTPSKAASYEAEETMAMDEFGMPRSSSNPWDEELLPTVKRRLAQQAMMSNGGSRLSGVDGLVDTWDKNGMPLSTRSITPRKSSIRDVSNDHSNNGPRKPDESQAKPKSEPHPAHNGEMSIVADRQSQERPNTAASERMKRLTDQLDFGFQSTPTIEERNKLDQQETDAQKNEISGHKHIDPPTRSKVKPAEREALHQQQSQEPSNKQHRQAKADQVDRDQDVGGGCCKCTVM